MPNDVVPCLTGVPDMHEGHSAISLSHAALISEGTPYTYMPSRSVCDAYCFIRYASPIMPLTGKYLVRSMYLVISLDPTARFQGFPMNHHHSTLALASLAMALVYVNLCLRHPDARHIRFHLNN